MNLYNFIFFLSIIGATLAIAYWSAQRGTNTYRFYAASGRLTGFQNGLAMAGDFVSAASFLGVTGAIALYGLDGTLYAIGFLTSYSLLWVVAQRVHQWGRYTLAEVVCARFPSQPLRMLTAMNSVFISLWYMVPQLVAAGLLMKLLLGLHYTMALLLTGGMMTIYVVFGGMVSTSWIQIIKITLLLSAMFLLALVVYSRFDFHFGNLQSTMIANNPFGTNFFHAGHLFQTPIDRFSLLFSLILGTAGLPHILVRFFTVRTAMAVRQSIITATGTISIFYVLSLFLGMGAVALVGWRQLHTVDPTGNLAVPLLAHAVGGNFLTAFIVAVAFATILAVVTGLLLTATAAFSHDIVASPSLLKKEKNEKIQLRTARMTAGILGLVSILLSFTVRHMNVTFPVSLIFVAAAATNLPLLLFTFYWPRFTSTGAISGILSGLLSTTLLALFEGHVFGLLPIQMLHISLLQQTNLGLIAIPCGFLGAVIGTFCTKQTMEQRDHFIQMTNDFRISMQTENR